MPEPITVHSELRRLRQAAGLTQRQLSERLNVSPGQMSRIESGQRTADSILAKADEVLGSGGRLLALRRGDPSGIEGHLRAVLLAYRGLGRQLPPRAMEPLVHAQYAAVDELRARHPRLRIVAARFAELAGWIAQERGDDRAAAKWTNTATGHAAAERCVDLVAYTRVRLAEIALYRTPRHAVELAEDVLSGRGIAPPVLAAAARVAAQARARLGDAAGGDAALDRMAGLLAEGGATAEPDLLPSSAAGDPYALATGWCAGDLGRHETAVHRLSAGYHRLPERSHRMRGLFGARLCAAAAVTGDRELALTAGWQALDHVRSTGSATGRSQLRLAAAALTRSGSDDLLTLRGAIGALVANRPR